MQQRALLILIHLITIIVLALITAIAFSILIPRHEVDFIDRILVNLLIFFISFTISSGIYKTFLNRRVYYLWHVLSVLAVVGFIFITVQFTWGFDWKDSKIYIGFLIYIIASFTYPEFFKIIRNTMLKKY